MLNDDMLQSIEYLREKADVSYEEAAEILERNGGNVMSALVELERQGRVRPSAPGNEEQPKTHAHEGFNKSEAKERAGSFVDKALKTRLVVERKRENGERETVANLSAPFAVGAAIVAPWLAAAAAGVAYVTGHDVKIKREDEEKNPE